MTVSSRPPETASPEPERPLVRGNAHTAGFADALGTRHLKFDHAAGASLEILNVRADLGDVPAFEAALRARVEEVRHVQHPSLATIHGVERRAGEGLCLISRLTSGRRVSELAPKAQGVTFALELLRLVTPALAMLHRANIAHGVISAERIVVARDGRLVVADYVFGSAIEALNLSRTQLIDLGLIAPAGDQPIRFDGRTDMAQLGFVSLSLLLGRTLDAGDYPEKIPALLDEFVRGAGSPILSGRLRGWLERAMQISPRSFASARDANDALGELPDDAEVQIAAAVAAASTRQEVAAPSAPAAAPQRERPSMPAIRTDHAPVLRAAPEPFLHDDGMPAGAGRPSAGWMTRTLAVLAGVEAVVIAALLLTRPAAGPAGSSAPISTEANAAVTTGAPPAPAPSTQAPAVPPALNAAAPALPRTESVQPTASPAPPPAPVVPAAPRVGSMTISSPIDLQVFKDGDPVGSTAGPITLSEGTHGLDFVNDELGFRIRQNVSIKNGKATPVTIAVPNGRVSINAVPWADVIIDGNAAGETPIANLSLPIGSHEIVFRHPQLGERKQTVVIKVDGLLRVTQTLQPGAASGSAGGLKTPGSINY